MSKLLNVVYLIEIENYTPSKYIGSKCKCYLKDGLIYTKRNKIYKGSPSIDDWDNICQDYTVTILYQEPYQLNSNILIKESEYQLKYDVVNNPDYFNRSIAVNAYFNLPDYGMYRDVNGTVKKLHCNDERVLSGEYFGINTGRKHSEEHKRKIAESEMGELNHFYGKKHSEESKRKMALSKIGKFCSDETRQKMSMKRKGMVNMINKNTLEKIRINTDDKVNYDLNVWISVQAFAKLKK